MEVEGKHKSHSVTHFVHWGSSGITALVKTICESDGHSFVLLKSEKAFSERYASIDNKLALGATVGSIHRALFDLLKFYRRAAPEIIHAHSLTPFLISVIFLWKSKLIFHVHNEYPYLYSKNIKSRVKRIMLKAGARLRSATLVAVTTEAARRVSEIAGKDCTVIVNGIADKGAVRRSFVEERDELRFYSLCRLERSKNLEYTINLIDGFADRFSGSARYSIYGDGPERQALKAQVESLNGRGVVRLKGFTDKPQDVVSEYDYFISASYHEGLSLSVLNAMRGCNIVLMTRTGELSRYLIDERHCHYLTGDLDEDISILEKVVNADEEKKAQMQSSSHDLFENNFTDDTMLRAIRELHSGVLSTR